MTEEEVEGFIIQKMSQLTGFDDEGKRQELNKDLNQHGWDIKTLRQKNGGFSFNVQLISVQPASAITTPSQPSEQPTPTVQSIPRQSNGVRCKKCGEFNPYLEVPFHEDGTHTCYRCRNY